eukprot:815389-Pyramimonas_sp.AAC.1
MAEHAHQFPSSPSPPPSLVRHLFAGAACRRRRQRLEAGEAARPLLHPAGSKNKSKLRVSPAG